jgi:hypothetical protein
MKTKNILLTAFLVVSLLATCKVTSAQSSLNTKAYSPESDLEQVLGIKIHTLVNYETKLTDDLNKEKTTDISVVDLSSLEKDIRFNPSDIEIYDVAQPDESMEDILKGLYKDTKFNPADYLENK